MMAAETAFDYYYGDESSQFSFYRIPRQLITGDAFRCLSTDAKLLYGLLLDRMGLSAKNGWYDELERVRQGQGRPTKIYVKRFTTRAIPPPPDHEPDPATRLRLFSGQDCGKAADKSAEKPQPRLRFFRRELY